MAPWPLTLVIHGMAGVVSCRPSSESWPHPALAKLFEDMYGPILEGKWWFNGDLMGKPSENGG